MLMLLLSQSCFSRKELEDRDLWSRGRRLLGIRACVVVVGKSRIRQSAKSVVVQNLLCKIGSQPQLMRTQAGHATALALAAFQPAASADPLYSVAPVPKVASALELTRLDCLHSRSLAAHNGLRSRRNSLTAVGTTSRAEACTTATGDTLNRNTTALVRTLNASQFVVQFATD